MIWLLLLPFRLLFGIVFGLLALPFVILLLPFALLLWLPFALLGLTFRVLTALIYLNDDYEGGETSFTSIGLNVKGRTGDVLVFRSQGPDGNVEPLSWHAGLPVIRGTKYLASRWIHQRRYAA